MKTKKAPTLKTYFSSKDEDFLHGTTLIRSPITKTTSPSTAILSERAYTCFG